MLAPLRTVDDAHLMGAKVGQDGVIETHAGRRIGYLARGPRQGRPVMYLHGLPGSRLEQRLFPDEVLDRFNINLISVDRPGFGRTDPMRGNRSERVADVVEVCDALNIGPFALMAASSGGSYALVLAAHSPERVSRVVLLSAQMPYDEESALRTMQPDQLQILTAMRLGRIPAVVEGFEQFRSELIKDPLATMGPNMATLSPLEQSWCEQGWVREVLAEEMSEAVRAGAEGLIDDGLAWPEPFDIDLGDIVCPVRAVHGSADDWEPLANLQRVLTQLRDVQTLVLEGLNHFGPLVYPDIGFSLAVSDW